MMTYRQDKRKNKHIFKIYFLVVFLIIIFTPLGKFLGKISSSVFSNTFAVMVRAEEIVENIQLEMMSKDELIDKIKEQQTEIDRLLVVENLYNQLRIEHENLYKFLEIKEKFPNLVLAEVVSSPSQSIYNTFLIKGSFTENSFVFSESGVPIGTIDKISGNNSNVLFFSNSGREVGGFLERDNTPVTLVGRGSGNFVISLPREIEIIEGDRIYLPGIKNPIGRVGYIEFDARDPFQKVFVVSEQNIYKLDYVLVESKLE